jgi:hypothetical protein
VIAEKSNRPSRHPNGGLIVTGSPSQAVHRKLIVTLAGPGTGCQPFTPLATWQEGGRGKGERGKGVRGSEVG